MIHFSIIIYLSVISIKHNFQLFSFFSCFLLKRSCLSPCKSFKRTTLTYENAYLKITKSSELQVKHWMENWSFLCSLDTNHFLKALDDHNMAILRKTSTLLLVNKNHIITDKLLRGFQSERWTLFIKIKIQRMPHT